MFHSVCSAEGKSPNNRHTAEAAHGCKYVLMEPNLFSVFTKITVRKP